MSSKRTADNAELVDKPKCKPNSSGLTPELLSTVVEMQKKELSIEIVQIHSNAMITRFIVPTRALESRILSLFLKLPRMSQLPKHPQGYVDDAPENPDMRALYYLMGAEEEDDFLWDGSGTPTPVPQGTVITTHQQLYDHALVKEETRACDYNILTTVIFTSFLYCELLDT